VAPRVSGERLLIVNADDLGLADGVSEGVIRAARAGIVTSTSALANIDAAPGRIAAVRSALPQLPIGLHANLTTGAPVLPPERAQSLVDRGGRFFDVDRLLARLDAVDPKEVRAELAGQAERLLRVGIKPDHIDFHELPFFVHRPFLEAALALARNLGVPVRRPLPESVERKIRWPRGGAPVPLGRMLRFAVHHPRAAARLIDAIRPASLRENAAALDAAGVRSPDWFIDGFSGRATVDAFVAMLRTLPPGIAEVAVHPGVVDDDLRELGGGYVEKREIELATLLDPRVREVIADERIRLADFSVLALHAHSPAARRSTPCHDASVDAESNICSPTRH
jgi:predicted glycoside hydrolase/deacetylase ChbG (UPF0249 family)